MHIVTALTERLGIHLPIVQAPIGSASTPALAAAVSEAGGLGMLSITWRSLEETRDVIRATRKLTDRPFGVNLVLQWDPTDRMAIALEEGVPVVSFFWGDPSPWVHQAHEGGALVMHTVGDAAEAARAVAAGVDIIVAQGGEAGGHVWGDVGTIALVPVVVDAVAPVPVVAAGGIGDGRGLAAVLGLGGSGVWLGTRFLTAEEAPLHPTYRERLFQATETATVRTELFDVGWPNAPLRTLRTSTFDAWEAAGRPSSGSRPGEGETIAWAADGTPLPRYADDIPMTGTTGDIDAMVHYAGQSVGFARRLQPAGEIVREIAAEAIETLDRMAGLERQVEREE